MPPRDRTRPAKRSDSRLYLDKAREFLATMEGALTSEQWDGAGLGYTGYDSIYRFKGREAAAVVVTDLDPLEDGGRWSDVAEVRSLLYVAVTRALSRVVVLAHADWRDRLAWDPMDGTGLDPKETAALPRCAEEPDTELMAGADLATVCDVLAARVDEGDALAAAAVKRLREIAGEWSWSRTDDDRR